MFKSPSTSQAFSVGRWGDSHNDSVLTLQVIHSGASQVAVLRSKPNLPAVSEARPLSSHSQKEGTDGPTTPLPSPPKDAGVQSLSQV